MERIKRAIYIGSDEAYLSEVQSTFSHESDYQLYLDLALAAQPIEAVAGKA